MEPIPEADIESHRDQEESSESSHLIRIESVNVEASDIVEEDINVNKQ